MKRYLGLLLVALMMFSVLFVAVSCGGSGETTEPQATKYTVTFDTQGGSEIAPVSVNANKAVKKPTDPTRDDYVFFGWYKEAACKNVYNFKNAVKASMTLYAKWIERENCCLVTYDLGYSSKKNEVWMEKGKAVTKPTDPSRTNYRFLGWFADAEKQTDYNFSTVVNSTAITIYAKWIDNTTWEKTDPILPKGTGRTIPTNWSTNAKGMTNLPDIKYKFSGGITNVTNVTTELKEAIAAADADPNFFDEVPKKVLFVFSDGWGVNEVTMSRAYKGELILDSLNKYYTQSKTDCYSKYSHSGNNDDYTTKTTTDSPAGGTQVLAGYKTRYGYISLDVDGNKVPNLSDVAREKNWKVACVTNDNIADATPACSIIHDTNRYHSDVLYYKELMVDNWDLLMGWDWGMGTYFTSGTWEDRLLNAAKEGIKDANSRESTGSLASGQTPIAFFKSLSTEKKAKVAPFLIYYTLWEMQDESRRNSWQRWTRGKESELNQFLAWLDDSNGLAAVIKNLNNTYGNPSTHINRFLNFGDLLANTNFNKPVLGSWTSDTANYEATSPNRGYLLHDVDYPSWPEMVAYTIYQMDKMAGADGGFFVMLENTCTDGWGHSENFDTKYSGMLNEVQCFDEGVAIAIKYVLEHPDTLLVVTADHETGGYELRDGWENDISKIKSTTTGHSSQNVPLYAFGAGAKNFTAEAINAKYGTVSNAHVEKNGNVHEGWITGALIGQLISGDPNFGQPANYKGK